MKKLYWDCAAAMPPVPEVLDLLRDAWAEHYANQESRHALGYLERKNLIASGRSLAEMLTGDGENPVIWGGSATEIFRIIASAPCFKSALCSTLEHPAVIANFRKTPGFHCWHADHDGGIVPVPAAGVDAACFHQVQNELGVIQDLDRLFAAVPGACRVVDAVQAVGKVPLWRNADVWVISGAKFGAPGGAAAILKQDGKYTAGMLAHVENLRHTEYALGRFPAALAPVMLQAAAAAAAEQEKRGADFAVLKAELIRKCAPLGVFPTLPGKLPEVPHILNLLLPFQQSAIVVRALSELNVFVASGSACSSESDAPSASLLAVGKSRQEAYRALRLSFSPGSSVEDADFFISKLEMVLKNY